jgi:hypothetical protein
LNSNVTLNAAGSVNPPNFTLSSGIVVTGAYNLIILSNGASVSSGTTTAYVQGTMGRAFPSTGGSRSFPIGDASMFRPLTVRTTSSGITSGHYLLASVTKQPANTGGSVFSGGIDFVSNVRHWKLTYYQNTSTTNSLTFDNFSLSYGADDKLITGQSNFCAALSENARGSWSGIGPENHVVSIGSSPTIIQSNTISTSPPSLQDNGSLYLALAKTTGSRGFVTPLRVNAAAEGLTNGASSVNDTFMVELKNITSPYATHQQSRALSNNGENYYADLSVPIPGTYYIAIRNRNSLETWSAAPVDFNGDSASYDFTASASNAYGGNMKYKAPRWCLYSGDINNDGIIDFTDILLVDNDQYNFTAGYVITDVTGDNFVDYSDMSIVENNSNSFIVRQYPGTK